MVIALVVVTLDGVPCYFAARALGGSQGAAAVWTGLFLASLSAGRVTLGFCRKRCERVWRTPDILVRPFVMLLGTRGKGLVSASDSLVMTTASSASRPATPRSSLAAVVAIVTAFAAATRVTVLWDAATALP
jgi:hypothetical protein